jgi:tetratricopeptide (TPR) repeat protein
MIASFEALFPALRAGGLYIFEDMAFHFNESARRFQDARAHQGLAEMPIFDYLNKFIRARAASVNIPEGSWGFARYAFENIDSITVAGGFIAVRKTARRDFDHAIASFERELSDGRYDRNAMAFRYAEYLLKHRQNPERAAALLTDVTAAEPGNEPALVMLLDVLLRIDAVDQAADVATRLVNIDPSNAIYWDRLAGLERRCNRPELEASALRRLIELQPKSAGHHLRLSEISEDMGDRRAALELARGASALEPDNVDFRNRVSALESNLS